METTIAGFHQDAQGHWVAELSCEHARHMRHRPPWEVREWVTTAIGRQSMIGTAIDCTLCDGIAMPATAREYKRTATFTEETLPPGLRSAHRTKASVWARIVVEEGTVEYHVRGRVHRLGPGDVGLVEPERWHHLSLTGAGRLHVEFWREP